jgi:hypothetical protein
MGLLHRAQQIRDRRKLAQQGREVLLAERLRLLRWQAAILLLAEGTGISVRQFVGLEGPRE